MVKVWLDPLVNSTEPDGLTAPPAPEVTVIAEAGLSAKSTPAAG